MQEAFNYANENDNHNRLEGYPEDPMFHDTSTRLGEDLAFDFIPPAVDLWIRHSDSDTGRHPVRKTQQCWTSPSLSWLPASDGTPIDSYEGSYINPASLDCDIEVSATVTNRGREKQTSPDVLDLYWSFPDLTPSLGAMTPDAGKTQIRGGRIGSVPVSAIESGDSVRLTCLWERNSRDPELARSFRNMTEGMSDPRINRGIGLFAALRSSPCEPAQRKLTDTNGAALRMEFEVPKHCISRQTEVLLSNPSDATAAYSLSLERPDGVASHRFDPVALEVELEQGILEAWNTGGGDGVATGATEAIGHKVYMDWEKGELKGLTLAPGQTARLLSAPSTATPRRNFPSRAPKSV